MVASALCHENYIYYVLNQSNQCVYVLRCLRHALVAYTSSLLMSMNMSGRVAPEMQLSFTCSAIF